MAQWITIEETAEKYGFEKEYVWILIEMREITVCYERPGVDIIDDGSVQDFINRNKHGLTLMYIEKLERFCIDKSKLCSIYMSLLGKQDKEIGMYEETKSQCDVLQTKCLEQYKWIRKLEQELSLEQTNCRKCWLRKICLKIWRY